MFDHSEIKANHNAVLCCWCGIPFGSASLFKGEICVRCYKLLIGAGLKDEEIFRGETEDKNYQLTDRIKPEDDSTEY